jgi:signal transduction histidine kinase/ligand-binding sensor domain-containing protein
MSWRHCLIPTLLLYTVPAFAVDPNTRLSQYAHTAWRIQDGLFNSAVAAIAQTRDGYLWIGTEAGLLRFDGVRFVPWKAEHGERLPSHGIQDLLAARDGSLWIASGGGGLSRWNNQKLTNYPARDARDLNLVLEDSRGEIWSARPGSLCRGLGGKIQCYGAASGVPLIADENSLIEDREGNLWLGGGATLVRWTPRSHTVYQLTPQPPLAKGIHALTSTPDGTIWVGTANAGPGQGLQQLVRGCWRSFKTAEFDSSNLTVSALYADHEGAVWVGTFDHGVYRISHNNVDHFDSISGLSGDSISRFSEDREGNLWVATAFGVDRFADTAVVSFSSKEGLCCPEASSIVASRDGGVWTGGDGALTYLRNGMVSCLRTGKGLPGSQVTSMMEDHAGRLWAGVDNNLWVQENGAFRRITKMDGSPAGFVTGIAEDTESNVWITVNSPHRILMRVEGRAIREDYTEPKMPRKVAADPTGGIWIGLLNGDLAHYRNGEAATYRFPHGDAALVTQLLPNSDGSVLASTTYGLIGWKQGKLLTLTERNGLPCEDVYGIAFDKEGNLWLYMECGLGEMMSADLRMWLRNPGSRVSMRTFGVLDGVRAGPAVFLGAAASTDGRLWFANGHFLQMIEPGHVRRNSVPPPVHIEQVIADRKSYPATGVAHLPALTRDLEIDYVGLSFVAPQKVRFRYRLEGRDESWQEPGTRHQAFYNDLRPGTYRFRVIACNNSGVWNEAGAALDFSIAPAYYQTRWFETACVVFLLTLLAGFYRYRLHRLAHQFNVRLEERVGERTRIARELHDTLLQGFQGLMFRLQAVNDLLPEGKAKDQLEGALERADQAIAEGRTAVHGLRSSSINTNDLAEAVKALGKELAVTDSAAFSVTVEGAPRDLHPIVRDEIYRMAVEALRNAFCHADARHIETEITYTDRALRLRIRDDGKGIPPEFLEEGRRGHYGLCGMRERAQQIGGELAVWSRPGAGTEIELTIASASAYPRPVARPLFGTFRRKGDDV